MIGGDPQQRVPSSVSGVSGLCTLGLCWVLSSVFRGSKESNKGGFPRAGPPVTAQNEEVGADSSKIEGTPQGWIILGSLFGPQMRHIQVVFTMRSRFPKGGPKGMHVGSYVRCLERVMGSPESVF